MKLLSLSDCVLSLLSGGMFEYVSGANFFGEIVEWTGYTVATWSFPALAFLIFTIGNLVPRALAHYQ